MVKQVLEIKNGHTLAESTFSISLIHYMPTQMNEWKLALV